MNSLQVLGLKNELFIFQRAEPTELVTSYVIKDGHRDTVLTALEASDPTNRHYGESPRAFHMRFLDQVGNEVFHIDRPEAKYGCPCFSAMHERALDVYAHPNHMIGYIEQVGKCFSNKWDVYNHLGAVVQHIEGDSNTYQVMSTSGERVAMITKQFASYELETVTIADSYSLTYICPLDVMQKAVLLAAALLIDFSLDKFCHPHDVTQHSHAAGGPHYQYNNNYKYNLNTSIKYGNGHDTASRFYERQIEDERRMNEENRSRARRHLSHQVAGVGHVIGDRTGVIGSSRR